MVGWIALSIFIASLQVVYGASLSVDDRDSWKNDWDKSLNFECPSGQYISNMKSTHSNSKEDRRWDFACKPGFVGDQCYWMNDNNYINDYDKEIRDYCNENGKDGVIVGFNSVHNNKKEDRRWKIKCCQMSAGTQEKKNCAWTSYINDWDKYMNYNVPLGKAIHGIQSFHNNKKEDRRWQLYLCEFSTCTATKMNLLSNDFLPQPIGSAVIGIGTMPMCNADTKGTLAVSRTRSLSETITVTAGTSSSFAVGAALTISQTVGIDLEVFQASQTLEMTASTEFEQTWSKSTDTSVTHDVVNAVGGSMSFMGINGGIIVGLVDEYQFDKTSIPVEYEYKCTTSVPNQFTYHTLRDTIKLSGTVYGHVHFDTDIQKWDTEAQCQESKTCLRLVNAKLALSSSQLIAEFRKCF